MEVYEETGNSVIGVQEVPESETHRYGIIDPLSKKERRYEVQKFVEKPEQGTAPSNLAIMGRYVLTPEIFDYLKTQKKGAGNEIQLTDAIARLSSRVLAYSYEGVRYDVGDRLGYLKATVEYGLRNPQLAEAFKSYLEDLDIDFIMNHTS